LNNLLKSRNVQFVYLLIDSIAINEELKQFKTNF